MKTSSESSFYVQLTLSDRLFRTRRLAQAHTLDQQFGRILQAHWDLHHIHRQRLGQTVREYGKQHKQALNVRLHVRRCRYGCATCPHTRLAFFRDGKSLDFPVQTRVLRSHGIHERASDFVNHQKALIAQEEAITQTYRTVQRYWDRSLDNLRGMDEALIAVDYPNYPTPFIAPDAVSDFIPLPYTSVAIFSQWIDNALFALAFSMQRYAMEYAHTKYGRAKQGFFGIHKQRRKNILLPLFPAWRLYFRGFQGVWFSTHHVLYKKSGYQLVDKQVHPVQFRPRFIARSGNKAYFNDLKKFRKLYSYWNEYAKKQTALSIAFLNALRSC